MADARDWPDAERTVTLQCVLKRQSPRGLFISFNNSLSYTKVKVAVLRDLINNFNRWCAAVKVESLDDLHDLIVLEQFKNSVLLHVTTYLIEQQVKNVSEGSYVGRPVCLNASC
ncbi:hypothetical protein LDENG_00170750 [Lucifuga dentata]|nr:hypothetical protein LDENG_00170750 [Lucifuga dentata]